MHDQDAQVPSAESMILGLLASGAVLGSAFLPAGTLASNRAYVGKWAATLALCKNGQDMEIAPLLVTTSGYDQHEGHSTFKSKPKAIKPEAGVPKPSARSKATSKPMTSSSP
jgi:hypothetical protein